MSFSKILIISGPTATGKTSLAVKIAQKFNGELISADSRQIYRGMDIGTGKDHPKDVPLHLIDIINPNQSFSVSQYRQLALQKIREIQSRGKLPIIVGGTGLYIDSLTNPKETYTVKPNLLLRFFLDRVSVSMLQKILKLINPASFSTLNSSDFHNPRRLVRRIEIDFIRRLPRPFGSRNDVIARSEVTKQSDFDFLHLSLTAQNDYLFPRIDARIDDRLNNGLLDEIKKLLSKYKWNHPGLNTLAYKEFKPYFQPVRAYCNTPLLDQCIAQWHKDEHAYARRQKTWFKKIPNIHFIDITQPDYKKELSSLVSTFITNY